MKILTYLLRRETSSRYLGSTEITYMLLRTGLDAISVGHVAEWLAAGQHLQFTPYWNKDRYYITGGVLWSWATNYISSEEMTRLSIYL